MEAEPSAAALPQRASPSRASLEPAASGVGPEPRQTQAFPDEVMWGKLTMKQKYDWVYEKVRLQWCGAYTREHGNSADMPAADEARLYRRARSAYARLGKKEKKQVMREWLLATSAPDYIVGRMMPASTAQCHVKQTSVMLTYFVEDTEEWNVAREHVPALLADRLREMTSVVALWQRILDFTKQTRETLCADDFCVCLEYCPTTLATTGRARLHFHLLLKCSGRRFMRVPPLTQLSFESSRPNLATLLQGMRGKVDHGWSGFFYCSVEKIGHLFHSTSREPFRHYLVQSSWVMNLLQGSKITHALARDLIVKTCSNLCRQLQELDVLEREHERALVEKARALAVRELSRELQEWVEVPAVTRWEQQYSTVRQRYSFLVLAGPSKMGKTMYARSLTPPDMDFLEINCSAGQEPDLRAFRFSRHALILFDEIQAQQVAKQRKLFQASPTLVQLGASPTNCHCYQVYCHRVRFVLSSNTWETSLAELSRDDRDWILVNSVYVRVDTPLWVQPSNAQNSDALNEVAVPGY